jgi:BirA family transcriptional regulator, biotin operon repressor / biotin---[acetyl-CoA-carboxylase] ligase
VADSLGPAEVLPRLRGRFGRDYRYAKRCASTQRLLGPEDPEGAVAVCEEQAEGRGRLGRRWLAPAGTSILCSLALRPPVPPERLPELTLVAGEACADAIATVTGLEPAIKLPNDVLIGGRKAAGVLAEASEGRVTLGIGVNVNQRTSEVPLDAAVPATSLRIEVGRPVDRVEVLVTLLERFEARYDAWLTGARRPSRPASSSR